MTSDRVYRRQVTIDEALAELRDCAATQFDPDVVAAATAELAPRVATVA
jgi:HD-GYP domain-containing protein (c-di-GMP phosphodiesterase class II)